MSAGGDEMPGHATRRQFITGVLVPRGVRAGTDAGRTRAAEGNGRRSIVCTRNRTDPLSGCAKNGDAPGRHTGARGANQCLSEICLDTPISAFIRVGHGASGNVAPDIPVGQLVLLARRQTSISRRLSRGLTVRRSCAGIGRDRKMSSCNGCRRTAQRLDETHASVKSQ